MSFHPYLNFGGTCRAAFTRYQEIFGGELFLMPMSEVPGEEGGSSDLLAHAALTLGDTILMASDAPTPDFESPRGMYVNWAATDVGEAKRIFDELADGGQVEMAFAEAFFSPGFGICVDRFGIPWMVSTEAQQG